MAYSQDYRQMILEKLNSGYSYRELAAEYGISRSKRASLSWQSQLANQKHKQCHWRTVPKSINCSGFV